MTQLERISLRQGISSSGVRYVTGLSCADINHLLLHTSVRISHKARGRRLTYPPPPLIYVAVARRWTNRNDCVAKFRGFLF